MASMMTGFYNPWAAPIFPQPRFSDFRPSDNIEDRRKEMFNSFPQAPQMPNVFGDKINGEMVPPSLSQQDYAPQQPSELSNQAGAGLLDGLIQQYLAARR